MLATSRRWQQDPTKVLVSAAPLGLNGWQLAELLHKEWAGGRNGGLLLCLVSGDSRPQQEDIEKVVRALQNISRLTATTGLAPIARLARTTASVHRVAVASARASIMIRR